MQTKFRHTDEYAVEVAAMSIEDLPRWLAAYRSKAIPSRTDMERTSIIEAEIARREAKIAKQLEAI